MRGCAYIFTHFFFILVHSLRKFSHPQLIKLFYKQINDNELRNFVLDAIPLLKTDAGITLMKEIVESETLPATILDMWFSTLPFYHDPTRGMIATASVSIIDNYFLCTLRCQITGTPRLLIFGFFSEDF